MIFENKFGGTDLEKFKITTTKEAMSILKQVSVIFVKWHYIIIVDA